MAPRSNSLSPTSSRRSSTGTGQQPQQQQQQQQSSSSHAPLVPSRLSISHGPESPSASPQSEYDNFSFAQTRSEIAESVSGRTTPAPGSQREDGEEEETLRRMSLSRPSLSRQASQLSQVEEAEAGRERAAEEEEEEEGRRRKDEERRVVREEIHVYSGGTVKRRPRKPSAAEENRNVGRGEGQEENGEEEENQAPVPHSSREYRQGHDFQRQYARRSACEEDSCDHGTFSPRATTFKSMGSEDETMSVRSRDSFGGRANGERDTLHAVLGDTFADGVLGGAAGTNHGASGGNPGDDDNDDDDDGTYKSTTMWLAKRHGIKKKRLMYLTYYFPFAKWITQYRLSYLKGDFTAALTMSSFYIPMALSYASNLGHVPPINGLYSFVFNPLIYAFFGTCPQMVVGPEAPGSLLVGNVVRSSIDQGHIGDENGMLAARVAGVVTGMAGAIILVSGLTRLGFLDSVLSKPFLRGFISAVGIVILADQLIPEMGLVDEAEDADVSHGSSWAKLVFLIENVKQAHPLTCYVSFGAFAIIMICRESKKRLQSRYPSVVYIPDRFVVVVLSAILTYAFRWDRKGLDILGEVKSSTGRPFSFHWPLIPSHMIHIREAMGTSFLIALLGFFESSVAAKSLGGGEKKPGEGIRGVALSANRELVALGIANLVGGCFMALPAFGGYGRSKVNSSTGGKTPMSSILLSLFTVICTLFVLPWFYYLPKGVLSAMVSVVAYSLVEECPHDIRFFVRIRGYSELSLMATIFLATIFYSLPLGIALGMGLSLLSVIKHATKPRIQILGRVPGTGGAGTGPEAYRGAQFENAEENPSGVEFIEGVLIVKIPEPLTFANTGDLKNRLRRLELYGTTSAHPALPRIRDEYHNSNVVFDVHGVTSLDGSGAQVLFEIVDGYVERGARVFFCRVPGTGGGRRRRNGNRNRRDGGKGGAGGEGKVMSLIRRSGIVERCGGPEHFVRSVDEALRLAEKRVERYRDEPEGEERV